MNSGVTGTIDISGANGSREVAGRERKQAEERLDTTLRPFQLGAPFENVCRSSLEWFNYLCSDFKLFGRTVVPIILIPLITEL